MKSREFHRSAAISSLVAFALATTVGGPLHDHQHQHAAPTEALAHREHQHTAGHADAEDDEHNESPPAGDDDCWVCRFLSQPPLVALTVEISIYCGLVVELTIPTPPQSAARIGSPIHSRAPPRLVELS